jgi:hypothetical protein
MRRAAEKDRNDLKAPCIHCDKTSARQPKSLKEGGTRSDPFDSNEFGDFRMGVRGEASLTAPLDVVQEMPEYDFLFSTSKDGFLSTYDTSFIAEHTNDVSESSPSSLCEPEPALESVSYLFDNLMDVNKLLAAPKRREREKENQNQPPPPAMTASFTARTSLHLGAEKGHTKIVSILLNSGAAIESVDFAGRTALHCAVESNQMEVVRILLDRGADAERKNTNGMSALHLAVDNGYEDIVLLLIENGVDPNM